MCENAFSFPHPHKYDIILNFFVTIRKLSECSSNLFFLLWGRFVNNVFEVLIFYFCELSVARRLFKGKKNEFQDVFWMIL